MTRALLLCAASALLAVNAAAPAPLESVPVSLRTNAAGTPLTTTEIAQLESGEVLSTLIEVAGSPVKEGVGILVIDALPAKTFATVTDYEHGPEYLPYVATASVERPEGKISLSQSLEFPFGVGNRHYTVNVVELTKLIDGVRVLEQNWTYAGVGNIKDTSGSWQICPWGPTRTFLRYTVNTDPGGSLPNWVKNSASKIALPKLLKAIRARIVSPKARAAVADPPVSE
jgi:hypothetical protein